MLLTVTLSLRSLSEKSSGQKNGAGKFPQQHHRKLIQSVSNSVLLLAQTHSVDLTLEAVNLALQLGQDVRVVQRRAVVGGSCLVGLVYCSAGLFGGLGVQLRPVCSTRRVAVLAKPAYVALLLTAPPDSSWHKVLQRGIGR